MQFNTRKRFKIDVAKKHLLEKVMSAVDYKISYDAGDRETPSGFTVDFDYVAFYNYLVREYGEVIGIILYESFDDFDVEGAILEISGEALD